MLTGKTCVQSVPSNIEVSSRAGPPKKPGGGAAEHDGGAIARVIGHPHSAAAGRARGRRDGCPLRGGGGSDEERGAQDVDDLHI